MSTPFVKSYHSLGNKDFSSLKLLLNVHISVLSDFFYVHEMAKGKTIHSSGIQLTTVHFNTVQESSLSHFISKL